MTPLFTCFHTQQTTTQKDTKIKYVICTSRAVNFSQLESRGLNFVKPQWLELCLKQNKIVKLRPDLMVVTNEKTMKQFESSFDALSMAFRL
jgi:hypothetical protein